jgi:hypothetical protein
MSDTCPNITEDQLASKMMEIINNNPEMKTVINTALETCDIIGGRKGRKGKMLKGGDRKGLIKGVLYAIIAYLVALIALSSGVVTVTKGLEMVMNGECYEFGNRFWSNIGYGNPVCNNFISLTNTIIGALQANPEAIQNLIKIVGAVSAAPFAAIKGVDALASTIDNAITTGKAQAIDNGNNIPMLTERQPQPYGGKTRRKRSSRKKSRKSRTKKSRRNK